MDTVAHKKIKDFSIDGQIYDEADIIRLRYQYETITDNYMRVKGYIPHLDLDSSFTLSYNGHSFDFKITRYGIYVGKAKAKCYTGVIGSKLIPMTPTTKTRSEKSSAHVESQ